LCKNEIQRRELIFNSIDKDNSGTISQQELSSHLINIFDIENLIDPKNEEMNVLQQDRRSSLKDHFCAVYITTILQYIWYQKNLNSHITKPCFLEIIVT